MRIASAARWLRFTRFETLATILAGSAAGIVMLRNESAVFGFCASGGAAVASVIACRYPLMTVVLWAVSTQFLAEFSPVGAIHIGAGIDMLFSDPIFIGFAGATVVAMFAHSRDENRVIMGRLWTWMLLVGWMLFHVFLALAERSIVNILGELRRYSQHIFIVPYIALFFRTKWEIRRLFVVVTALAISFVVLGILKGAIVYGFAFDPYMKWLGAHSALGMMLGAFALALQNRYHVGISNRAASTVILISAMALLVITNHRSVWMAAALGVLVIAVLDHVSISAVARMTIPAAVAVVCLFVAFPETDLIGMMARRLQAFTAYQSDHTASWRMTHWTGALNQVKDTVWIGGGLGKYFNLFDARGNLVTASLHNQYVQLIYQIGIVGLVIYVAFVVHAAIFLLRTLRRTIDAALRVTILTALVALISTSAYYMAYGFDYFSWLYVSLGMAAAVRAGREAVEKNS